MADLSWLEMVKVVPTILLNYDLEWANGDQAYEEYGYVCSPILFFVMSTGELAAKTFALYVC